MSPTLGVARWAFWAKDACESTNDPSAGRTARRTNERQRVMRQPRAVSEGVEGARKGANTIESRGGVYGRGSFRRAAPGSGAQYASSRSGMHGGFMPNLGSSGNLGIAAVRSENGP